MLENKVIISNIGLNGPFVYTIDVLKDEYQVICMMVCASSLAFQREIQNESFK